MAVSTQTANALRFLYGNRRVMSLPVSSGRAVKPGQLLSMDGDNPTAASQTVYVASTGMTISSFVGIAIEMHGSTEAAGTILVETGGDAVYECKVAAHANGWAVGQALKCASAGGVSKTSAAGGTSDIMLCVENNTAVTATTIKAKMVRYRSFWEQAEDA